MQLEPGPRAARGRGAQCAGDRPDLIAFLGDQSYDHKQHTAAWLLFGSQFKDLPNPSVRHPP
ncbi:MAG: hypothetical protein R3F17_12455 [Planctomycetota bacterium]